MFGADASFGGLDYFFEEHGDYNIMDYKRAKQDNFIPQDYSVWWGYEDDKLYEYAKMELTRLAGEDKPFYFVMETADTHFPDGYLSPNAKTPFDKAVCKRNILQPGRDGQVCTLDTVSAVL